MTKDELWSQENMKRPESWALRAYSVRLADPRRSVTELEWLLGFRDALKACDMDPGWEFVPTEKP